MAQIPRTSWPPIFSPFMDSESHTCCFSMCNCQILSREHKPSPPFQWTLRILVHCSWEGLGQKLRAPWSCIRPTPSLSLLFTHSSSPSNDGAINTLATPSGPVPSPLQAAEQHHDLRVTYPFGIPDLSNISQPPGIMVTLESGLLGLLPNYFPSPCRVGRRRVSVLCNFYTRCLQLCCLNLLRDSDILKDTFRG